MSNILSDIIRYQCETFRGRCGHLLPSSNKLFTASVEELYILLNQCHQNCKTPTNTVMDQLVKQACPRDVDIFNLLDRQSMSFEDHGLEKLNSALQLFQSPRNKYA